MIDDDLQEAPVPITLATPTRRLGLTAATLGPVPDETAIEVFDWGGRAPRCHIRVRAARRRKCPGQSGDSSLTRHIPQRWRRLGVRGAG